MKQERKVVTRGAIPQPEDIKQILPVPGSIDDMITCGERPPQLVFLAVVKILDRSLEKNAGQGFYVEMDSVYGTGGTSAALSGSFDDSGEALEAAERLVGSACREAEEFGI